ncbi:MAG: hypothetical protein ABR981_02025 [Candidatus Micrarchaeaceae archaeon]|jgi:hypothetical protein
MAVSKIAIVVVLAVIVIAGAFLVFRSFENSSYSSNFRQPISGKVYYTFSVTIPRNYSPGAIVLRVDGNPYSLSEMPDTFQFNVGTIHNYSYAPNVINIASPFSYTFSNVTSTCGLTLRSASFNALTNCTVTGAYVKTSRVTSTSTIGSTSSRSTTSTTIRPREFYLSVSSNTINGNTLECQYLVNTNVSGYYSPGSNVPIIAYSRAGGCQFLNWTGRGIGSYTGFSNNTIVTVNSNITEVAYYHYVFGTTTTAPTTTIPYNSINTTFSENGLPTNALFKVKYDNNTKQTNGNVLTFLTVNSIFPFTVYNYTQSNTIKYVPVPANGLLQAGWYLRISFKRLVSNLTS